MLLIADGGLTSCNIIDTMDAIMLTKNLNYIDGVKIDIRKSLDNQLVVSKYDDLSKLTLSKKSVSQSNYEYLRKVKFPSHIFKYYIPTLEEVLKKYSNEKIIVLELYDDCYIDDLCRQLYNVLIKYSYKYYFLSESLDVLTKLKEQHFQEIGRIVDDKIDIKIIKDINSDEEILDNDMIITGYPEKFKGKKQ